MPQTKSYNDNYSVRSAMTPNYLLSDRRSDANTIHHVITDRRC